MICVRFPQIMSPCWAPRWVGIICDDHSNFNMSTKKKAAKRPLSKCDSETDSSQSPLHFARFVVIEAEDPSTPVTNISHFVIEKQISSILGTPKSVKKLKNSTILVECFSKQQATNLLKYKMFHTTEVTVYPHKTLNQCKGVIRCNELSYCDSIDDILTNLKPQGVSHVKRISVNRNGQQVDTSIYILTFSSPVLPSRLKIGY